MPRFSRLVSLAPALAMTACGGTSAPSVMSNDAGSSISAACTSLASARCALRDRCTDGVYDVVHYGDAGVCETQEFASCESALDAPGQSQTATTYTACATAISTETCADYFTDVTETACIPSAGAVPEGSSCTYAGQCATTYCQLPLGSACGTCQPLPSAGEPCILTGECGRDLDCTTDGLCAAFVDAGGPCSSTQPCGGGFACVGASGATCQAEGAALGVACDGTNTKAPSCDRSLGFYCASDACAALNEAAPGEPCGEIPDAGEAICTSGALCVLAANSKAGTCVATATVGMPCDDTNGPPCLSGARCVLTTDAGTAGTCQNLDPAACAK